MNGLWYLKLTVAAVSFVLLWLLLGSFLPFAVMLPVALFGGMFIGAKVGGAVSGERHRGIRK